MFFKLYELKDDHIKKKKRKIAVAAVLGERAKDDEILQEVKGFQELFYTCIDYTELPSFDLDTYRTNSEQHLKDNLEDYNLVASDVKLDYLESDFQKALGKAYMANKVKKQYLAHQMDEMLDREQAMVAGMIDDANNQKSKQLLMN